MSDIAYRDARTPEERDKDFLPGMGKPWLLPIYDLYSSVTGVRRLHERAAARAGILAGERVLDVGCGTANLSFAVLRVTPDAVVTGVDPDAAALRIAARKARWRRVGLELVQGYADRLPADDGSLDHVVSALAIHHVDDAGRSGFAREVLRVLRPGGTVTIADFGTTAGAHGEHRHGLRRRTMHNPHVARNLGGGLNALLEDSGLVDVREAEHIDHRLGEIAIVQATRP